MRRGAGGLLLLLALLAACGGGDGTAPGGAKARLSALRASAALAPCPTGFSAELPDVRLPCLDGRGSVPLRGPGTGRPTLVNVWATWCGPCVREIPHFVALAAAARGQLDVVGVLTQDEASNGLEFAQQFGMHYASVIDDEGQVMRAFSPGPPVTLFLDARGRVTFVQRGEIRGERLLRALVKQHLGVDVPSLTSGDATP